ncbi:MAG: hypothetical protein WCI79_03320 [Candidatus Saccharibacteria bacterium]
MANCYVDLNEFGQKAFEKVLYEDGGISAAKVEEIKDAQHIVAIKMAIREIYPESILVPTANGGEEYAISYANREKANSIIDSVKEILRSKDYQDDAPLDEEEGRQ